ncbi:hypothetical protein M2284_001489 [Rhodococcus sp. LBL1]|nr:hypothetical protein [Rhodococcus sp. LBL1]MDH6682416.1 hypothetical protein [Rhodococcus sp. LBL2]
MACPACTAPVSADTGHTAKDDTVKHLPTPEEITRIRRDALLNRAVEAYKFFYPSVSMLLNFEALDRYRAEANRGFLIQLTTPDIVTLTQNSDTPYGLGYIDTSKAGPVVVEVPAGPVMGVVDDANFRFVTNMGIVGEEAGAGAKYLFVPPGHDGLLPDDGYVVKQLETNRALVCIRVPDPDTQRGLDFLRTLRVYPLAEADNPPANDFQDVSDRKLIADPVEIDATFGMWEAIKRALDTDVLTPTYYAQYGMLADLGIRRDRPFEPDDALREVLTEAATKANEQLVVAAFADESADRLVWPDRRWEWVVYSEGDNGYYERDFLHLSVRERWFYQATLETPKMFMHREGAGSIYWLAGVDGAGDPLDGGTAYTLTVPTPVPASQFWSITLYDLDTRSEINTPQFKPVLTSLRDDLTADSDGNIVLHFGPESPAEGKPWLQTNPGSQWFAYFRIYGPGTAAFDGTWKPTDFTKA